MPAYTQFYRSMYTVVKQLIKRLSVASALFITLIISSVARAHQTCGQEELVHCAQPLQVLTESGLAFVASKKDLEIICPDLEKGMHCVHSYTRRCMSPQQRSHFMKLFHGTKTMIKDLCNNSSYQEEYLKYAPCMRSVVNQTELCFKKYQHILASLGAPQEQPEPPTTTTSTESPLNSTQPAEVQDNRIRSVCCSFMEYTDCSVHSMRRVCGDEAAQFGKGFLDKMSSSMIKLHCRDYIHGHGAMKCPHISSGSSSSESSIFTMLSLTVLSVLAMIVR